MGQSTLVTTEQREMPLFGVVGDAEPVDASLIGKCEDMQDAVLLCVHLSRFTHAFIGKKLGIDKGHWARILQGQAHFPLNKLGDLMRLCRNLAPMQWLSLSMGVPLLIDQRAQRKAELLRELALLEGHGQSTQVNSRHQMAA